MCSPSRNSFLSGRRPDTTKIWNFQQSFRTYLGINATSWPGAFKTNGWITSGMGKVYHPGSPSNDDGSLSWSLDWAPYMHPSNFTGSILSGAPDTDYQDGQITATALSRLEKWANESAQAKARGDHAPPFFIAVGLHKPHIPWARPTHVINQNGATSGFEMWFVIGSQHLWCRVSTVPTKARPESRFCNKDG